MDESRTDNNLQFGNFAVQFGGVTEAQLQTALARWNSDQSRSLAEVLVEIGALTADTKRALETLMTAQRIAAEAPPTAITIGSDAPMVDTGQDTVDHSAPTDSTLQASADAPLALDAGGRFERQSLHAEGGLGKVYEAHDRQLNRTVALKEIKGRFADDVDSRERFTKEAEITGRLEHPGIVPVYALGKYKDGRPYYAMRFIKGKSLRTAIAQFHADKEMSRTERALAMRSLLGHLLDVCDAIYYAHRRGIVHRDLKPSNIMLGDYGEVLVVDWGLAKTLGRREQAVTSILPREETLMPASGSSITETMVGKAIGSPAFMSPEQARGEHDTVEFESDVYGMGATLFMLLTGQPPVEGRSSNEILRKVRQGHIPNPRQINRSVPKALDAICAKAMAFEPYERYETVRELQRDLERYLADEPIGARRDSFGEKTLRAVRRNRWLLPAMVVGFLGVSALQYVGQRAQRQLTLAAETKKRELAEAFDLTAQAIGVVDPFASTDENVRSLQQHAAYFANEDVSDVAKMRVYDALVDQFEKFRRPDSATSLAEEAVRISAEAFGECAEETLELKRKLAHILEIDGKKQRALLVMQDVKEVLENQGAVDEKYYSTVSDTAALLYRNARTRADFEEALDMQRKVLDFRSRTLPPRSPKLITAKFNLARTQLKLSELENAQELLTEVGRALRESPHLFPAQNRLVMLMTEYELMARRGRLEEALTGYVGLYEEFIDTLKAGHSDMLQLLSDITVAKQLLGRYEEVIGDYRKLIATKREVYGSDSEYVWIDQLGLGSTLLAAGQPEDAIKETELWLDRYIKKTGFRENYYCHLGSRTLAFAHLRLGQLAKASKVVQRWEAQPKANRKSLDFSREIAAGELALAEENLGLVEAHLEKARRIAGDDAKESDQAGILSLQGALHMQRRNFEEAEAALKEAKELLSKAKLETYQTHWPELVEQRLKALEELR